MITKLEQANTWSVVAMLTESNSSREIMQPKYALAR